MFSLRRRLILWGVVAVGLPVAATGLRRAAEAIEARRGPSHSADRLRKAGTMADSLNNRLSRSKRRRR